MACLSLACHLNPLARHLTPPGPSSPRAGARTLRTDWPYPITSRHVHLNFNQLCVAPSTQVIKCYYY